MEFELTYIFRGLPRHCTAYIDASEEPCYVFVQLQDKDLSNEFGSDVTIKTDLETCLPRKDDFMGDIRVLRQAIFDELKDHPYFRSVKRQKYISKVFPFPSPQAKA